MRYLVCLLLMSISNYLYSQVYTEKQTRHRFAQLTLGIDVQSSFGGNTKYFDTQGIQSLELNNSISPRFIIGGTHFWGHADFYIAIPTVRNSLRQEGQAIQAIRGVETVFKYYPLRIEHNKVRPYIGTSLAPFFYEQDNNIFPDFSDGPELNHTSFPLLGGITFNSKNHLIELGVAWNYANNQDYYISRTQIESVATPPVYATLSYKYMLDTTIGAEKEWESGKTKKVTRFLADGGRLNGFYLGVGLSSSFWLNRSNYNTQLRQYIERYSTSLFPDFTLGYYLHKSDINFAVGYRNINTSTNTYGAEQQLNRKSFVLEVTKYLFDYHGFVPFVGPAVSLEQLSFEESFENESTVDVTENKVGYGLTFGWDIRPNRVQSWILRTNLRWYPNFSLNIDSQSEISFDNLEFNFIQLIVYPNRLVKRN